MALRISATLALVALGCDGAPPPLTVTPPLLKPTDGRPMGIAKLDFEKCDAIREEVSRNAKWHPFSEAADAFAARLGPPDGVRADGERYWLAVNADGKCFELVVGGRYGGYGDSSSDLCFPAPIGPPASDAGAR